MNKDSSMAGFAALLDQQFKGFRKGFNPGDTVNARVVRVGEEYVTLDVNAKTVGLLPVADVTDEEGDVTVKRGDMVEVSFVAMQKDAYLFAKADVAESAAIVSVDQTIQRAFDGGLPLEGTVEKEVKGGYEVTVCGQRGFCPYSQIDRVRKPVAPGAENPYVGKKLQFIVQEYGTDDRGVNLIVSHRVVQERELAVAKDYLRDTLEEGQTLNGTVVKVLNFGAFVDLGGVEGLVPVREISWDKVNDPNDFLKAGELVTVKILSLDWERERISLSIRQCQAKPLKPRTPEEIARDAEAQDVADWMEAHAGETDSFSSLGKAFDGLKI
ncbi:MAG: S1 RNA-binding domain-containing protein [Kiritimatiellae bacterium]|nr:S1 RNA-binding domain-containing protein [Kiritimatiellia bacterium]